MITQKNSIFKILIGVLFILSIPLIAMQFTKEVNWTVFDFLVMGILLFSLGLGLNYAITNVKQKKHRILWCLGIIILFALIWIELAVGIFGSPFAGS